MIKEIQNKPISEELPLVLNAQLLAKTLLISRQTAYNLLNSKDFPTIKIGKRMIVSRDGLINWMEKQTEKIVDERCIG